MPKKIGTNIQFRIDEINLHSYSSEKVLNKLLLKHIDEFMDGTLQK